MHHPRITFIGAGSTIFAQRLIGDILLYPALAAADIVLHDIDPARLAESEAVAHRINSTLGTHARITATTDLSRALDGADYAFNMIQVGGYRPATTTDFDLPNAMGLRQTIGDTLGIGGIMRGVRSLPVLIAMSREMERLCPDVLHINYGNPMAINCIGLNRASPIRTVGLCHSVRNTTRDLAQDLGIPADQIDYLVAGVNHMAFFLKLQHKGRDLYPALDQVIAEGRIPPNNRVRYDVYQRFGRFVTESSEHFAEYVPWYIKRDRPDLIEAFNIPLDEYPRRCEAQIAAWQDMSQALRDPETPLSVRKSAEYGAEIIDSIETGTPRVIYGNVINTGLIDNLPAAACVEVPCLVDSQGVQPTAIGALPLELACLMQTQINVQLLTAEAVLSGRKDHIVQAALLDPHTAAELDPAQISALVDALLAAHGPLIPAALR